MNRRWTTCGGILMAAATCAAVTGSSALAASGTVKDTEGRAIADASVCHFQTETNVEIYCVGSDARGHFEIVDSNVNQLRVSAEGYFPEMVPASGHHAIVLERSPTLLVHLVDASSREPLEKGEVFVIYPSARKKGPFPVNRAGVRIARVLPAGEVRLIAHAEGYAPSAPFAVTLERGKESEATLALKPLPVTDGEGKD
jgi:hypothetical protein